MDRIRDYISKVVPCECPECKTVSKPLEKKVEHNIFWNNSLSYDNDDIVHHNRRLWKCIQTHMNNEPRIESEYWKLFEAQDGKNGLDGLRGENGTCKCLSSILPQSTDIIEMSISDTNTNPVSHIILTLKHAGILSTGTTTQYPCWQLTKSLELVDKESYACIIISAYDCNVILSSEKVSIISYMLGSYHQYVQSQYSITDIQTALVYLVTDCSFDEIPEDWKYNKDNVNSIIRDASLNSIKYKPKKQTDVVPILIIPKYVWNKPESMILNQLLVIALPISAFPMLSLLLQYKYLIE